MTNYDSKHLKIKTNYNFSHNAMTLKRCNCFEFDINFFQLPQPKKEKQNTKNEKFNTKILINKC